ncbi:MAG: cytochrome c [Bryobacterales bacterium]|nr:cytochrome c [Bryobacterales bacterium]
MKPLAWSVLLPWVAIAASPTFHRDVAPILQKHCQTCHRPGEAAPMSLLTYKETRPWAKAIRESVVTRRMPPWHADPTIGKFSNTRQLTDAEVETIRAWTDQGSREGSIKQAPKPLTFIDGWAISRPDLIFEMPVDFEVPNKGELDYMHFAVPTNFAEDRWIQEMEVRPGNRAVVHHIGVYLRPKGSKWLPQLKAGEGVPITNRSGTRGPADELFAQYVPGGPAQKFPEGQARLIPAGAELIFQLHYQPNGKPGKDRSRIGLVFAKTPVRERIHTIAVGNPTFVIPPGAPDHPVEANWPFLAPARVLSIIPHMHLRGKSFDCWMKWPDGRIEPVIRVPQFNRNWQIEYQLAQPLEVPVKSRMGCKAIFDNSPNNPWNPDPKAEVRWGDQTRDEMMVAYVDIAVPAASDPFTTIYRYKK